MINVLFRVDANSQIGWGHFYRSLALAEMLKEGFSISFAMTNPSKEVMDILAEKSFHLLELPFQEYCHPDERDNKELQFDLAEMLPAVDLVVLDGYWFGPKYQKELRNYPVKVALLEDEGKGTYLADLIINHAPGVHENGYQTDSEDTKYALGTNYALLRPSFLKAASGQYDAKSGIQKVLISFGGSDHFNFTTRVFDWFVQNTKVNLHVIVGADFKHQQILEKTISLAPFRVKISRNLNEEQMLFAMKSADAAVLPASGVLFESIACRLPAISGTYTQNQEAIFNGFLAEEAIIDGGDFTNLSKAWIALKNTDLADLKNKQASMIDGKSPERIKKLFQCLL